MKTVNNTFASLLVVLLLSTPTCSAAFAAAKFDQNYSLFRRDLERYVEKGDVHYRLWQKNQDRLKLFLKSLETLSPEEFETFTPDQKHAFWLNVYNALTIKVVLDHYPIHGNSTQYPANSFRQIPGDWENGKFNVMGKEISLYDIEHDKLRREVHDPRSHFAVVCAANSCAHLNRKPYLGSHLQNQLEEATRRFLRDPNNLSFDKKRSTFMVSKIFSWFTLDFAAKAGYTKMPFPPPADEDIIIDYTRAYMPSDLYNEVNELRKQKRLKFDYLPYDWGLNDAD